MDGRKNIVQKKIGITSNVIVDRLGLEGYSLIKRAGFDAIDFNMQRGFFLLKNNSFSTDYFEQISKHKREIENNELYISQTHAPYYISDKYMNNKKNFECYLDAVEQSLLASIYLGCKRFVVHPLHEYSWMKENEFELTLKMINRIYEIANKEKVHICIENLPYEFCGNCESHMKFIKMLEQYDVKACFDTGHSKICNESPLQHLKALRDYVYAVHIHENNGIKDMHKRISANCQEWKMIINEMIRNKNIISISLETSGVYKICDIKKIQSELILDYESINSYIKVE